MPDAYQGVWPAMLSPLDASGEPDLEQVEKLVELFIDQRLGGIYALGSTGQAPLLSVEERKTIAERTVKSAAGRIPIIVHIGSASTDVSIALARHAAEIGADAVASVPPYYYRYGPDVIFEHYRRIGLATDLPFYAYHLGMLDAIALNADEYVDRLLDVPHIAGMKITSADLHQFGLIHARAGDRLTLFSGVDELMCHAALSGASGAIGTFYNVWGPACGAARSAFTGGSFLSGRRFMHVFQTTIAEVLGSGSIWTFLRSAMRLKYDIEIGSPKAPLGSMDQTWEESDIRRLIDRVDDAASALETS